MKKLGLFILLLVVSLGIHAHMPAIAEYDSFEEAEELFGGEMMDSDLCDGPFLYYVNDDGTASICGYDMYQGNSNVVEIPSRVNGLTVTSIVSLFDLPTSFSWNLLKIPNTVTEIGALFWWSGPDSPDCSIGSVFIPNSVQKIDEKAFVGASIASFSVDPHHPVFASVNGSLYEKETKTLVSFAASDANGVPEGILSIGSYAFANQDIRIKNKDLSFLIPSSVKKIGEGAFMDCFIICASSEFTLDVQTIDANAFNNATIWNPYSNAIELNIRANEIGDAAFANSRFSLITFSTIQRLGYYAFVNTEAIRATPLVIPSSLIVIEEAAFRNSIIAADSMLDWNSYTANEHAIIIPEGIEKIGPLAFSSNESIDRVELPQTLTEIGASAFAGCTELRSITLPTSLTSIGWAAFDRTTILNVASGSYAAQWALENGYAIQYINENPLDWLN